MKLKKINIVIATAVFLSNICLSFAGTAEDTLITTGVKAQLLKESDIPSTDVQVETKDNIVIVSGTLDTNLQVERAIEIAASFDNVKDIISHLKVKNSNTPLTDTLITAKVKGKILNLFLNKKIAEGYDLHVETTDKKVHVFGTVMLDSDIQTIKNAITSVKDVGSVETNIKVKVK